MDNSGGNEDYTGITAYLGQLCSDTRYIYGSDNSLFMANYTALKIFGERFRGLSPETWNSYMSGINEEIIIMESIREFYSGTNYDEFKNRITDYENDAVAGDAKAAALLREYYTPGSSISGFGYIEEYLGRYRKGYEIDNYIAGFVAENSMLFPSVQEELKSRDYLTGMLGYINSEVPLATVGEDVTLSAGNLNNLNPAQLSLAAEGAERYINSLEKNSIPVPAYLYELVHDLASLKSTLNDGLFISDFMSGKISGTVDEIYSNAKTTAEISGEAAGFVEKAINFVKSGQFSASESAEQILAAW